MILKTYGTIWAAIALMTGILFLSGNLTALAVIAIGFVCFGMVFMGMVMVLPATIAHHKPVVVKPAKSETEKVELAAPSVLHAR